MQKVKAYYKLTKPGIIRGNIIHVLTGVLVGAHTVTSTSSVIGVLLGTALIVASACVVNNFTDRNIDRRMKRTQSRASVQGTISLKQGIIYASVLGTVGLVLLIALTDWLVVIIGLLAYVSYTWWYAEAKRRTVHSTIVGSLPGALPVLAGYVAANGALNSIAWSLFALIFVWQLPHFYAISVFRRQEYAAAGLPVAGVVWSLKTMKRVMLAGVLIYIFFIGVLLYVDGLSTFAGSVMLVGSILWIGTVLSPYSINATKWAQRIFSASLLVTLLLLVVTLVDYFLPSLTYGTI